jgi:hypothetical protein
MASRSCLEYKDCPREGTIQSPLLVAGWCCLWLGSAPECEALWFLAATSSVTSSVTRLIVSATDSGQCTHHPYQAAGNGWAASTLTQSATTVETCLAPGGLTMRGSQRILAPQMLYLNTGDIHIVPASSPLTLNILFIFYNSLSSLLRACNHSFPLNLFSFCG